MSTPRLRRTARDEQGATLVEMIVVLALTGLVLSMVAGGAMGLLRAANHIDLRTENVDHARLAITALSRDLRAAAPATEGAATFAVAGPFEAEFHARLGEGNLPVLIRLEVDESGQVIEWLTRPSVHPTTGAVTYPVANRQQRYLASYLHNDRSASSTQPMLRYGRMVDGEVVWMTPSATAPSGGPTLTEADRRQIRVVTLDLRMSRDQELRSRAQRVSTEVRVPNLRDGA